jgi:hypothetical protein
MVTSSRFLMTESSTRCAFCNEPFPSRDGYDEFWRTSDGRHFCSEFCADDAEEVQFQKRRAAALRVTEPRPRQSGEGVAQFRPR